MQTDVKQNYQDEQVARSYDRERFSDPVGRAFDALEKRALKKVLKSVVREVPRPSVLDIPCGTGRITELLLEQGLAVVGGDISLEMIEVAAGRCARFGGRVSFLRLDLDALAGEDGSYDLVSCIRLFHHLGTEVRGRMLRELSRVSRRYVLINVSYSSPFYRLRRRLKRGLGLGVSASSSTKEEIRRETSAAGLKVVDFRYVARFGSEDVILLLEKSTNPSRT
jgi:ubiquinone/menaquinone biosynthesis C-methylase UbiE